MDCQITSILKEAEADLQFETLLRKYGMSKTTLKIRKAKNSEVDVSALGRIRDPDRRFKRSIPTYYWSVHC